MRQKRCRSGSGRACAYNSLLLPDAYGAGGSSLIGFC